MSSLPFLTLGVHLQTKDSFVTSRVQNEYAGTDQRSHTKGTEGHKFWWYWFTFWRSIKWVWKALRVSIANHQPRISVRENSYSEEPAQSDSSRAFEHFTHYVSAMCLLIKFSPMVAFHWSVKLNHPIPSIFAVCVPVTVRGLRYTRSPEAVISSRSICCPSQLSIIPGSALSSRK